MKKLFLMLAVLLVLGFSSQAKAGVHVSFGIGIGGGYYGAPCYYGGYPAYYAPYPAPPCYYGYYGAPYGYYYAPHYVGRYYGGYYGHGGYYHR